VTTRISLTAVLALGVILFGCPFDADDPSGNAGVVVLDGGGTVTAVSSDGTREVWSASVASGAHGDLLVDGGYVFVISEDDVVVAFDGADGTELWEAPIDGTARGRMAILGDVLYVQTADEVVALDADSGGDMWASPYLLSGLSGSMVTGEGALFCAGKPTTARLDPDTGDALHEYDNDESNAEIVVSGGYAVLGGAETVVGLAASDLTWDWEYALDNASVTGMFADLGDVFVSTDNDGLLGFDSGLDQLFLHALEGMALDTPYSADGVVYVTESYGSLYALDASTGTELWPWHDNDASDPSAGVRVLGNTVYLALGSALVGLDADGGTAEWELGTDDTILDIEVL
jgi:outer membrane protein assembly factor BamB